MRRLFVLLTLILCACGSRAITTDAVPSEGIPIAREPEPAATSLLSELVASLPTTETVYDNGALVSPWYDASWTTHALNSTAVLENGRHTLSVTFKAWTALCFDDDSGVASGSYDTLSFDVYGGTNTKPNLAAMVYLSEQDWGPTVSIAPYCDGGSIATNAWTHCAVPLLALGGATQTITEIAIEESAGKNLSAMAISGLSLVRSGESDGGAGGVDAGSVDAGTDAGRGARDAGLDAGGNGGSGDAGPGDAGTRDASIGDAGSPSGGGTAPIPAMPHLTGRTAYASEGTASLLTDGAYRAPNAWTFTPARCSATSPCWGAVNVGAGPSMLLLDWSYEDGEGDFDTSVWGGQTLTAYSWLVSSNSTNGQDGTWSTALDSNGAPLTVSGNTLIHRSHRIRFAGFSWVKLAITSATANEVDEIGVWDASGTAADSFFFDGDSITHRCANLRGTNANYGEQPSFQADVHSALATHYPLQVGGGIISEGAADAARQAPAYLTQFPFVAHWFLTMGTNDLCGGASAYTTNVQAWIHVVKAAGALPILVHPIWGNDVTAYCSSNGPALNAAIDALVASNGLPPAVPLYEATVGHSSYFDSGDVHPNAAGCAVWNQTFATYAGRFY